MTEPPGDQREGADDLLALVAEHERWLASAAGGRQLELVGGSFGALDLSGRDLSDAWLWDCDFTGAQLRGTWLLRTRLLGCRLDGADLTGARMITCDASESLARGATLTGANLTRAEFRGADLAGADLARTYLCRTGFEGADLSGAVLRDADLDGTFFDGARLTGADVRGIAGRVMSGPAYLTDRDEPADAAALLEWLRQNGSGQVDLVELFKPNPFGPVEWRWPLPDERLPEPPPA